MRIIKTVLFLITLLIGFSAECRAVTVIPEVNLQKIKKVLRQKPAEMAEVSLDQKTIATAPVQNFSALLQENQSAARLTNQSADGQTAISIRGFGDNAAQNSLILIDGFPLTNVTSLAPYLNNIALLDLDHVDIFAGSQGTLWGSQAVGGVMNIVTMKPKAVSNRFRLGAGNYDSFFGNYYGAYRRRNIFYKLSILKDQTKYYRNHQQQKNVDLLLQSGIDYARGNLTGSFEHAEHSMQFPGGLTEYEYYHSPKKASELRNHAAFLTNRFKLLNQHAFDDANLVETRIYYDKTDGTGYVFFDYNRVESIFSFHPKWIRKNAYANIIAGYYLEDDRFQLTNVRAIRNISAEQQNLYVQYENNAMSFLQWSIGARAAEQSNQGGAWTSTDRALVSQQGLVLNPGRALQAYLRHDGNFRFPKANEIGFTAQPNQPLQVQLGSSYEAGFKWQHEELKALIGFYTLRLNHEIAFNPAPNENAPFGCYENLAKTVRNGVTMALASRAFRQMRASIQLNAVDARFLSGEFKSNHVPAVPQLNGLFNLRYPLSAQLIFNYSAVYNGSQYPSEDFANVGRRLKAYWLQNAALQYQCSSWRWTLDVNNLFNQNYAAYALYDPLLRINTYYPGRGRTILLSLDATL